MLLFHLRTRRNLVRLEVPVIQQQLLQQQRLEQRNDGRESRHYLFFSTKCANFLMLDRFSRTPSGRPKA